ncbi:MAG: acyl-CoA dehydrogenase family protein [Myxococcales bacterium]|nr:acyl-CoA dehydrogenase family protein [Myxococcales bacterium]
MDFAPSERAQELCALARAFIDQEVLPFEHNLINMGFEAMVGQLESAREIARQTGLFAPHMAEDLGGGGLDLIEQAQLSEVLGEALAGHYVFNFQAPDVGNMELLASHGSEAQKSRWLTPLVAGELRSTFLMTEPEHAGSNPVWMSTTAQLEDDHWVIRGHKWFATAADGAAFAIVMAVTDPDAESAHQRASMIVVPTDTPGFDLVRNVSVMGHEGAGWMSHGEVLLDVRVPAENLIGERGSGFRLAQARLGHGRIHHASRWIGVCNRALDLMCKRAAERELSPGRPLGTKQTVQTWIAESRAEIECARLLVLQTAWKIEQQMDYRQDVSLVKFHVAGVMQRVLDRAIQAHGALGMSDDTPLAFWYAHERAARIYDGPDEVHKTVVARRVLRKYGVQRPAQ